MSRIARFDRIASEAARLVMPANRTGIIAAYTRSFCGTCNRIRITPTGTLKTCLYDDGVLNVKDLMRLGYDDNKLKSALIESFGHRAIDGWQAEKLRKEKGPVHESMATIGG